MKFLITASLHNKSSTPTLKPELKEQCAKQLSALQREGVVEEAYVVDSGGMAIIVNAESLDEIQTVTEQHDLSLHCTISMFQVTDLHLLTVQS